MEEQELPAEALHDEGSQAGQDDLRCHVSSKEHPVAILAVPAVALFRLIESRPLFTEPRPALQHIYMYIYIYKTYYTSQREIWRDISRAEGE